MKKAIIFTGKEGLTEVYQLMIGTKYFGGTYDHFSDRIDFFDSISNYFISKLMQEKPPFVLGTYNGYKIDSRWGKLEQISKLESQLLDQFRRVMVLNLGRRGEFSILLENCRN